MDILKSLNNGTVYSNRQLQLILSAWVLSGAVERRKKIKVADGDVAEEDYDKRSIYSLLYALYRAMGEVRSDTGKRYQATFNTWGYAWPKDWGPCPNDSTDPQIFGQNAYTGLWQSSHAKKRIGELNGKVHIVEMGCGTGAGAHHICSKILPNCTYEAVDMQLAGVQTCREKFVPHLKGRLKATHADATKLPIADHSADFIAVNETHVTEVTGKVTDEDERFFRTALRVLKPGGYLVWGNAIPDPTWKPCFDFLDSIGMKLLEVKDVTEEAVKARDDDKARIDAYADQMAQRYFGFRIPMLGSKKRQEASAAWKNFCRNPGTRLYEDMRTRRDTYKVIVAQKSMNGH
jgi:ubiquinone/menaquinone biosynthesis C-methylase UbiE